VAADGSDSFVSETSGTLIAWPELLAACSKAARRVETSSYPRPRQDTLAWWTAPETVMSCSGRVAAVPIC